MLVLSILLLKVLLCFSFSTSIPASAMPPTDDEPPSASCPSSSSISVAFLGNSILYYNDCPRIVQRLLEQRYNNVVQDSCLRGGASLSTLLEQGNGMANKFKTEAARINNTDSYDIGAPTVQDLLSKTVWDFVVLQDHTQGPARPTSRQASLEALQKIQQLLLVDKQSATTTTVVLLQTAAYRYPKMKRTEDLGDFEEFSDRLLQGYEMYANLLRQEQQQEVRMAPFGEAVRWLYRNNQALWEKLYNWDNFHPSPHGTWLEACVLYCTLTGQAVRGYNSAWWKSCRRMQPPDEEPLSVPSAQEAIELARVASLVCGSVEAANKDDGGATSTTTQGA